MRTRWFGLLVAVFLASGGTLAHAEAGKPVLLAAKKAKEDPAKKAAEEEAAKKAADEAAAQKAAEEAAAQKAAADAAAQKAAEEAAAQKAAEEAAAKQAAEAAAAPAAAPVESGRWDDKGFKDKFFPFWFPDAGTWTPQVEEEKWKFIIFTFVIGNMLPFSEVWLPLVMWKPKPELDTGRIIKPLIIKIALTMAGTFVMWIPLICCWWTGIGIYVGYILGLVGTVAWGLFSSWSLKLMMLNLWDDMIRYPAEKKADGAGSDISEK